jgi:parvulin-like peptidyl-prolyl isomerase
VARLRADFRARWGVPPTAAQLRAAAAQLADEEVLYREARRLALGHQDASLRRRLLEKARALGLGPPGRDVVGEALALGLDDDVVIRRLLAEKMRLVLEQDEGGGAISDAEVAHHLERERAAFVLPATVSFTHVFFKRGGDARRRAVAALARDDGAGRVMPPSDPFPLGHRLVAYTRAQLMARFGEPFAAAVMAAPLGSWSGPLESPFGFHLVRVDARQPERLPPLDSVRARAELAIAAERAAANLQRGMQQLRALYRVTVEL